MKKYVLLLSLLWLPVAGKNNVILKIVGNQPTEYLDEYFQKYRKIRNIKLRPVPWLTEEAIAFLEKFFKQHSNPKVLEFGSGASTVWFAKHTENLTSVEDDAIWFNNIKSILESLNIYWINYNHISLPYHSFCNNFPDDYFDLILVDGRNRKACILNAIRILKPGGILMLDNAERKYYQCIFHNLETWETTITEQRKPDSCGFWYKGWKTQWWIKP